MLRAIAHIVKKNINIQSIPNNHHQYHGIYKAPYSEFCSTALWYCLNILLFLKRYVLSFFLKIPIDGELLISYGNPFHSLGAITLKDRLANDLYLVQGSASSKLSLLNIVL
jgi:hypothetical protein